MGDWTGLLMAYGVTMITLATIILGAAFLIRRKGRQGAASQPDLVVVTHDASRRRRPAV